MKSAVRAGVFLLSWMLALGPLVANPAAAQSSADTGIVQITVTDAAGTKAALPDARVFLLGPTVASALTTKSGIVKYTDVPSGIYRVRVSKSGFVGSTSAQFEILGNKQVDVDVSLGKVVNAGSAVESSADPLQPKIIGRVQARVTVTTRDIDDNSAVRKISDSLTDALGKIAGVDVTTDSNDPNAAQTISLRGKDESQTAVTLDGIPLGPPGSAVNLRSVNTDLFSGAGVSFGAQAGSLGGAVNFRTLQPTQTWQSSASVSYGTFDRFNYQVSETGSLGKLGIAFRHSDREANNPLTFNNYLDASGIAYAHDGEASNRGDFLKLRYALGEKTTANFTGLSNNSSNAALCTQYVTVTPCGIGPGNVNDGKFGLAALSVQTLVGDIAVSVQGYVNNNYSLANNENRTIAGVLEPFSTDQTTLSRGITFSATATRQKHTITATGQTYAGITSFTPLDTRGLSAFVVGSHVATSSQSYQLADSYKVNDTLTLGVNASLANTTGASTSVLGGVSASWRPTSANSFNGSISIGSSQPAAGLIRTFSDPNAARVNCYAGTATVSGPGDLNEKQSSISYDAGWTHLFRTGQVTADVYRQTQGGQLINALVTGDSASLPPGYAQLVNAYYTQPTVCGSSFGSAAIYVNDLIGNTTRVYQGFAITARLGFGRNVVVLPSYTTASAVVTAADARLLGASSTTIIGSQLPGRPLHRGNLTIDGNLPRSGFELLANAQYVGPNNNQRLAPYTLVNAGISHQFGIGRLTVFASNLFNTESGTFSTLQYATPLPLSGGGSLLTAANPNTPRQYTVTYSFNTGANRGSGFARAGAGRAAAGTSAAASGAAPPAAAALRGRFRFEPPPAGVDPLTVASTRESCPADAAVTAQAVLAQIKATIAAFTAGTTPLPTISGITPIPHGDPKSTAWTIEFKQNFPRFGRGAAAPGGAAGGPPPGGGERGERTGPGGFGPPPTGAAPAGAPGGGLASLPPEVRAQIETVRAFIGCSYITAIKASDAKAKGIVQAGPSFGYAPGIGLYFVQVPDLGTGGGSVKSS